MATENPPVFMRKSPVQARSRATVDAITEAATHILEEDGLEKFNTNAIAHRAGVSIGSLYQYFNDKNDIMMTLIRLRSRALLHACETSEACADPETALRKLVGLVCSLMLEQPVAARIIESERRSLPINPEVRTDRRRAFATLHRIICRCANQAVPKDSAADLYGILTGILDTFDIEVGTRTLRSTSLRGIDAIEERLQRVVSIYVGSLSGDRASI